MNMTAAIRSELIKLRHTAHWMIHAIVPIIGAALFVFYFVFYRNTDGAEKVKLLMELIAMVFPLLISVVVGLNMTQEEKSSHFQNLLAVPDRKITLMAKLAVLFLSGLLSLTALCVLFSVGAAIGGAGAFPWGMILSAFPGLAFSALVLYALHLFLNLKYGLGLSLFWGVFECLQCILYSNVELHGFWRYIPFSWSANWIQDVFAGRLAEYQTEWITIAALAGCIILAIVYWFTHWEGRKNHE